MNNIEITLTLPLNVVDIIGAGLGKLPYETSQPIIDELRKQVMPQIEAAKQPAANGDNA